MHPIKKKISNLENMYYLPVVDQYSVFDEVQDVVKISQVSDVDDLSSGEGKEERSVSLTTSEPPHCATSNAPT